MQKWVSTLVGVAVVALVVWLVARSFQAPRAIGKDPHPAAAVADDAGAAGLGALSADGGLAGLLGDGGEALLVSDLLAQGEGPRRADAGAGAWLFDGAAPPGLPFDAPRRVRFGVVLVAYEGAQPTPGTRPPSRSKAEASAQAARLLATAQQDFHAAVALGDPGSADDVGRVKQGILEPAPEYVLFTLPVDGVAGPVDTPRGYWIVKRLE